jgi:hypothetical protein
MFKNYKLKKLKEYIEYYPERGQCKNFNHTNNDHIIIMSLFLRLNELSMLMIYLSFFFAIVWFASCEVFYDFYFEDGYFDQKGHSDFIRTFDLNNGEKSPFLIMVTCMYFMSTSLSTVGLGDIYAVTSAERVLCIVLLFIGVILFSYIMNQVIDVIYKYHMYFDDNEDEEKLTLFIGTLVKFNFNDNITPNFKADMEEYFLYRWIYDRNLPF